MSDRLPELVRKPGVSSWDCQGATEQESLRPPNNASDIGLENCLRIYPHLQHMTGMFIAVIEKHSQYVPINPHEATEKSRKRANEDTSEGYNQGKPVKKQKLSRREKIKARMQGKLENGRKITHLSDELPLYCSLQSFYGFKVLPDQFIVTTRIEESPQIVYYVSKSVRDIMVANPSLSVAICGPTTLNHVKCSTDGKREAKTTFCLNPDAIKYILPYLSSRVVSLPKEEAFNPENEQIKSLSIGCFVCQVLIDGENLLFPIWKGKSGMNVLVDDDEKAYIVSRLV
jgi:hypothetical protein